MLLLRPFRCEDCIGRFFGLLWRSPDPSTLTADTNSLVYRSSGAALHSAAFRGRRRPTYAKGIRPATASVSGFFTSWIKKPIHERKVIPNEAPAISRPPQPTKQEFFPEILGVILEVKHEPS
jgi:hypothetical protein